jgi:hypothetical protein
MQKNFREHFIKFTEMIRNNEHFALIRPADGEFHILQNSTLTNIDNWTFNKPINISEIELILANVEGVMSVPSVKISNLCGGDGNYSTNRYNIEQATQGKIVYPSLDPCVFEVKYPNKDIKGRAL